MFWTYVGVGAAALLIFILMFRLVWRVAERR